jgi:hypothetical protein
MSDYVKCSRCGFPAREGYTCGNCGSSVASTPDMGMGLIILLFIAFLIGSLVIGIISYRKKFGSIWWGISTIILSICQYLFWFKLLYDAYHNPFAYQGHDDGWIYFFIAINSIGLVLGIISLNKQLENKT